VQHARNLFDRAVTLLPRIDQLWYKYVYLEELLQNVPGARQVFERWMKWEPDDKGWQAYIKMEERYGELDRASAIYERWIAVRPEPRVWVKWGKFEEERQKPDKAREVFQMALEFFGDDEEQVEKAQAVFNAFAKMETRLKEFERARVIYKVRRVRRCEPPLIFRNLCLHSSLSLGSLDPSRRHCMPHTPSLRSNTGRDPVLNQQSLENGGSSMKRSFRMMDVTTIHGLTMLGWKRKLIGPRGMKARAQKKPTQTKSARYTSAR